MYLIGAIHCTTVHAVLYYLILTGILKRMYKPTFENDRSITWLRKYGSNTNTRTNRMGRERTQCTRRDKNKANTVWHISTSVHLKTVYTTSVLIWQSIDVATNFTPKLVKLTIDDFSRLTIQTTSCQLIKDAFLLSKLPYHGKYKSHTLFAVCHNKNACNVMAPAAFLLISNPNLLTFLLLD